MSLQTTSRPVSFGDRNQIKQTAKLNLMYFPGLDRAQLKIPAVHRGTGTSQKIKVCKIKKKSK